MFLVSREADPQTDEYHTELELESQPAAQVLWGALEGFSSHPGKNEDTAVFSLRKSWRASNAESGRVAKRRQKEIGCGGGGDSME